MKIWHIFLLLFCLFPLMALTSEERIVPKKGIIEFSHDDWIWIFSDYALPPLGADMAWHKIKNRPNELIGIDKKTCRIQYYIVTKTKQGIGAYTSSLNDIVKNAKECEQFIYQVWKRSDDKNKISLHLDHYFKNVTQYRKVWRFEFAPRDTLVKRPRVTKIVFEQHNIFEINN